MKIDAATFEREMSADTTLRDVVRRFQDGLFNQAAQIAACNRFHVLEQRLCRWLLAVHDRAGSSELALTHETISNVLGVRRAGVTVAIGALQRAGAISSGRGHITIRDRASLEAGSCGCYAALCEG
jgi:CRP-like cAMP-binding protein